MQKNENTREVHATQRYILSLVEQDKPQQNKIIGLGTIPPTRQGNSPRCVGEGVSAGVQFMALRHGREVFPFLDPLEVYERAKEYDTLPDHLPGSWVCAGMEAACRMIEEKTGSPMFWRRVFAHPSVVASEIRVNRKPVVHGMEFHKSDYHTGVSGRVMLPGQKVGEHCVCLHGVYPKMKYKTGGFFGMFTRTAEDDMFLLRNTNTPWDSDGPWFYPVQRVASKHSGIESCVFMLPSELADIWL